MKRIEELGISPMPWVADDNGCVLLVETDDDGEKHYYESCDCWGCNATANARLIAAAPELYEALAAFLNWYKKSKPLPYEENGIQMIAHYAKRALAKAAGDEVSHV